jgi:hypothetical protein
VSSEVGVSRVEGRVQSADLKLMRDTRYEMRDKACITDVPSRIPNPVSRIGLLASRIPVRRAALLAVLLACAGCGIQPQILEGNYLTYDHAFTDAAAAEVRRNAEATCRQRDQVAAGTSRACSLTRCTTSYQCMSGEDAARQAGQTK